MDPISMTALATSLGLYISKTFPCRYLLVISSLLKQTADTIDRVYLQQDLLCGNRDDIIIVDE